MVVSVTLGFMYFAFVRSLNGTSNHVLYLTWFEVPCRLLKYLKKTGGHIS